MPRQTPRTLVFIPLLGHSSHRKIISKPGKRKCDFRKFRYQRLEDTGWGRFQGFGIDQETTESADLMGFLSRSTMGLIPIRKICFRDWEGDGIIFSKSISLPADVTKSRNLVSSNSSPRSQI